MIITLLGKEIQKLLDAEAPEFPKYTSKIMNLANQNAQGTRPKVVGLLSELIQEFSGKDLEEWRNWYLEKHSDSIKNATEKVAFMVNQFREAINKIDNKLIKKWISDLVIVQTFVGLKFQEAILMKVAESKNVKYILAQSDDESKGIDGFIGDIAVSIKPITYTQKSELPESIEVQFIFYKKVKNDLIIEFNF